MYVHSYVATYTIYLQKNLFKFIVLLCWHYHITQIVSGGKLSWLQVLLKFMGKLKRLCHLCNTVPYLTNFMKLLLQNSHGS